jgi:hypothetical protein
VVGDDGCTIESSVAPYFNQYFALLPRGELCRALPSLLFKRGAALRPGAYSGQA